jgi:hypothetical protein
VREATTSSGTDRAIEIADGLSCESWGETRDARGMGIFPELQWRKVDYHLFFHVKGDFMKENIFDNNFF